MGLRNTALAGTGGLRNLAEGGIGGLLNLSIESIPDTVVLQYKANTWLSGDTTWEDDTDTADMSMNGDFAEATLSDGSPAIEGDGSDDYGAVTLPSSLEGSSLQSFTIEFILQYTANSAADYWWRNTNSDQDQTLGCRVDQDESFNTDNGNFLFQLYDDNFDRLGPVSPSANPSLDDGNRHDVTIIVNDASANDVDMIIDGSDVSLSYNNTESPSSFTTWDYDMSFWARTNSDGTIGDHKSGKFGAIRIHDTNINEQTIDEI